jgi:predicted 3-demethylubiquinone-9 3-methyltransferase (glyoxalase superfamily)
LDFKFLLPYSEAVKFFASIFPDSEMIDDVITQRFQRDEFTSSLL